VAENETIGEPVAFKVLNKHKIRKLGMQEKVKREIKAMKKLQHPHIVSLYQAINTPSDIFLALELATGGDLYDRICSQGKVSLKLSFPVLINLFFSLVVIVGRIRSQAPVPLTDICVNIQSQQRSRSSRLKVGKFAF
jgi:serine/threonine protein kinase